MKKRTISPAALALLVGLAPAAAAEVARVEVVAREPFAGGVAFGEAGAYEKLRGRLHYSIDPTHEANRRIADVELAPTDGGGRVTFSGDFLMLKPVDPSLGNHRLIYDVTNRGGLPMLARLNDAPPNNDPTTREDAGNGFLMRHGYTILWTGWNWDVIPGQDRLQLELPIAREGGRPLRGTVVAEIVVDEPTHSQPVAWGRSRGYPAARPDAPGSARLTVRDAQRDPRVEIPRERWRFGRVEGDQVVPDPTHVHLDGGFAPGRIYELRYEATGARPVGLGLASIRDAISFFRFAAADSEGRPNPLVVAGEHGSRPDPEKVLIFGISQSGRVIQHMLWQGFHVDEAGRMVFDGAMPHVSGAGKGSFNHRFAQTTRHPSHLQDHQYPADFFPFTTTPQVDPVTGRRGDVLAMARALRLVPRVMYTGTATEYWTRAASPLHTDVGGSRDHPLDERVRIYVVASAQHGVSRSTASGGLAHPRNVLDHAPPLRALLLALDRWVSDGAAPPPSAYPRIDRGELIAPGEYAKRFPALPGVSPPSGNLRPPRLDLGPRFFAEGIIDVHPPGFGEPYVTLVPAPDEDGNDLGGIRLPEIAVPLGSYVGWNHRGEGMGAAAYLARWEGSFFPFAVTAEQRRASGDPRPSLAERYASQADYAAKVEASAEALVEKGYLLPEDAERIAKRARTRAWPPSFD